MLLHSAVILTTLMAVACVASIQTLRNHPKIPNRWRWMGTFVLLGLLGFSLFLHPVINRALFQHTADRDLGIIQAALGGPEADLLATAGPPDRIESLPMTVWTYRLGSRWLILPKRAQVQVVLADGYVTQVTSIDQIVPPPGWRRIPDMTGEDATVTEPETETPDAEAGSEVATDSVAEPAVEPDADAQPDADSAAEVETAETIGDEDQPKSGKKRKGKGKRKAKSESDAAVDADATAERTPKVDPTADIPDDEIQRRLEAAILTSDRPPSESRLAEAVGGALAARVTTGIEALNALYEKSERSFRIEKIAGGYRFMTLPAYSQILAAVRRSSAQHKLSPSALETLAVVAYKQPALRVDVEAVRGVSCGESLRALMERGLVKIVGRSEELGRPMLYGTTTRFLEVFGLASLKELPKPDEMKLEA